MKPLNPFLTILPAVTLVFFFSQCDLPDRPRTTSRPSIHLFQNWKLSYPENSNSFVADSIARAGLHYCFFADGQVIRQSGTRYHQGTWGYYGGKYPQLDLDFAGDRAKLHFTVEKLDQDRLFLQVKGSPQSPNPHFISTGQKFDVPEDNPFHPANNQWRRKPARRETDAELRQRLKNHVGHYIKLLEAALGNTAQAVTFKYAPSCLQIYRSAIDVRDLDKSDPGWAECFFDRQDAEKATGMLREVVGRKNKVGTKSDMWAKDVLELLKAAEEGL